MCSGIKNISKEKDPKKITLEETLTALQDSCYICAAEGHLLKIYVILDTKLATRRWTRDGAWKGPEGGMRRQWEKQHIILMHVLSTKDDNRTSENTHHTKNYGTVKVLGIPIEVRARAWRETFKGGGLQLDLRR